MAKDEGKLGNLLALLDASAWDRFTIYLQSPAFNRSVPLRGLAQWFRRAAESQGELPSDAVLFEALFPEEGFDPVKFKNLKAALQRKLDNFFAQEAFTADEGLQQQLILRHLNSLGEGSHIQRYYHRAVERISELPQQEEKRQLGLLLAAEEWNRAKMRLDDRRQHDEIHSAYHHAWQFFQLQTLSFLVSQANRGAMLGHNADTALAERMLPLIESGPEALPAVQLYRALLDVFQNPSEIELFRKLQTLLTELVESLALDDARDVYTGAINHCIRRINAGESGFASTMLELYKEMDQRDLLLVHSRLPAPQFKNMVGLALRFQAFEWAQHVIDRYARLLDQDPYGNAEAFNQGMLLFAQRDFEGAERSFNKVMRQFEDVFFGLDARTYLLRIYYETGNWLGLESLADSFKMLLKRNKRIPKSHRESYLNTARFFARLAKLQDWRKPELTRLRAEIERTAFAATSKTWLLQKIDQLLASR